MGVYVHWPYCARICPYCDFNVYKARGREAEAAELARAIVRDLEAQAELTGPRELVSVFFGGGTPSLMDPDWTGEIVAAARRLWIPAADLEISLEANPTDAEADRFQGFRDAGVNRLSLGLQSLDDGALKLLGRNHDAAEGRRAAETAAGIFPRLSVDLIYARPDQTPQAWADELRAAVDLGAEHVSPYQLTIEDGTAFDRAVRRGLLVPPAEEPAAELYETTQAVLEAAGFEAYEVSNHARGEAARSRHNLVYWRGQDYVGAGPGAHGRITTPEGRLATTAADRPADYIAGRTNRELLTAQDVAEERLLGGLRVGEGVAFEEVAALGLTPDSPIVRRLVELALLADDAQRLRATPAGGRVLDSLTTALATEA
ncbi:radical SAM family heme chaperone HemW [Phenylobacterium sp. VNQ135]|uniref:radical SAM family heme chaperone HemW n=1 Tax=Phenylobacterium sp. VNQ135 TaxID=3400922 RepID=UPI003C040028